MHPLDNDGLVWRRLEEVRCLGNGQGQTTAHRALQAETPESVSHSQFQCKVVVNETTLTDFLDEKDIQKTFALVGKQARLRDTNWLGFLHVLVRGEVDGPRVHHGAREQVGQFGAEGGRHGLVGRREGRGHEEGRGLGCGRDHVGRVDEEAGRRGGVGRH